jgi:hypothetical protein
MNGDTRPTTETERAVPAAGAGHGATTDDRDATGARA